MMYRILANSVLFFSILYLPWWLLLLMYVLLLVVSKLSVEFVVWGIFTDVLYGGVSTEIFWILPYPLYWSLLGLVLYAGALSFVGELRTSLQLRR